MLNMHCQRNTNRNCRQGQHLLRRFPNEMLLSCNQTLCNIMDAVHHQPLVGLRVLHTGLAPEGKATGAADVFPEHGGGVAVGLEAQFWLAVTTAPMLRM